MIDLHTHSTVSDGEFSPEELVDMAHAAHLTTFAVSDHDTLEGSRRAMLRGKEIGVHVIPAVEISVALNGKALHLLGYYVDLENKNLEQALKEACDYRIERARHLVERTNADLVALGKTPMDLNHVLAMAGGDRPITRPEIADYLIQLGHATTRQEAFNTWLEKYNLPNKDLTVEDAITLIHNAGGVAVLAHPCSKFLSLKAVYGDMAEITEALAHFKSQGLDGVEVYRAEYTVEDQEQYIALAGSLGLALSGGSDFHGPKNLVSPDHIAAVDVPDSVAEALELLITRRQSV